jgi:hypothetical protein
LDQNLESVRQPDQGALFENLRHLAPRGLGECRYQTFEIFQQRALNKRQVLPPDGKILLTHKIFTATIVLLAWPVAGIWVCIGIGLSPPLAFKFLLRRVVPLLNQLVFVSPKILEIRIPSNPIVKRLLVHPEVRQISDVLQFFQSLAKHNSNVLRILVRILQSHLALFHTDITVETGALEKFDIQKAKVVIKRDVAAHDRHFICQLDLPLKFLVLDQSLIDKQQKLFPPYANVGPSVKLFVRETLMVMAAGLSPKMIKIHFRIIKNHFDYLETILCRLFLVDQRQKFRIGKQGAVIILVNPFYAAVEK